MELRVLIGVACGSGKVAAVGGVVGGSMINDQSTSGHGWGRVMTESTGYFPGSDRLGWLYHMTGSRLSVGFEPSHGNTTSKRVTPSSSLPPILSWVDTLDPRSLVLVL